MNDATKQIIEINGVKMEIDTRFARRIDTLRVGSKVKLLLTEKTYGSSTADTKIYAGVVVGFEPFEKLPTIVVCYLDVSYTEATVKFAYVNTETASKWEVIQSIDDDLPVQKQDVLTRIDREIAKRDEEIADLQRKRDYFLSHFNAYFDPAAAAA